MTAFRRAAWNFALEHAGNWASHLSKPLVVVEVLTCGNRWDSERHHSFVLRGMADNAAQLRDRPVLYYPYVEPRDGKAGEFLQVLAQEACLVVADDYPIVERPWPALPVRLELVDSNGLLPLRVAGKAFNTAHGFRRFLRQSLPDHLPHMPSANPLARLKLPVLRKLPRELASQYPRVPFALLSGGRGLLGKLPVNHAVPPVAMKGGGTAARARLRRFVSDILPRYHTDRNHPDRLATSGLSPYLHFGHISSHEIFHTLARREQMSPGEIAACVAGGLAACRDGWWGMNRASEAFLDELVTWRELGFNMCAFRPDEYDRYESLPDWVKHTLERHSGDRREYVYSLREFERAETHDPLWNAAQRQLLRDGIIHNYLRMLWGKMILAWSETPRAALEIMIELNNKYAIDGRDPNSYSGIFWVLGRYDRPWGPERPVFGTVRYMSSANTLRKLAVRRYLRQYQ
jgi:deoxyribodipyrimidine photo-lyase